MAPPPSPSLGFSPLWPTLSCPWGLVPTTSPLGLPFAHPPCPAPHSFGPTSLPLASFLWPHHLPFFPWLATTSYLLTPHCILPHHLPLALSPCALCLILASCLLTPRCVLPLHLPLALGPCALGLTLASWHPAPHFLSLALRPHLPALGPRAAPLALGPCATPFVRGPRAALLLPGPFGLPPCPLFLLRPDCPIHAPFSRLWALVALPHAPFPPFLSFWATACTYLLGPCCPNCQPHTVPALLWG